MSQYVGNSVCMPSSTKTPITPFSRKRSADPTNMRIKRILLIRSDSITIYIYININLTVNRYGFLYYKITFKKKTVSDLK